LAAGPTEAIFVDEAGDPGLSNAAVSNRPYYVFGFVYCEDPKPLRKHLHRLLKKMHLQNRYPPHLSELKFYIPMTELIQQGYTIDQLNKFNSFMPAIRTRAIGIICEYSDGVFAAVIDKKKALMSPRPWTPENLGNFVFAQTLIVNVLNVVSPPNPPIIYFDKGRLSPARASDFGKYVVNKDSYFEFRGLKRYRGSLSAPLDVASISEPGIWAADLISGAYYHKHSNKEWAYANICEAAKIGAGERLYWP
jgi:hypothetical protein